jgi:hypothetical protein
MRFQIDQHIEELKKKIDDIALAMIDETQKYEVIYLKNLKENSLSSFDRTKSIENDLNEIEDTFRNLNPLIHNQTIKQMQSKKRKSF